MTKKYKQKLYKRICETTFKKLFTNHKKYLIQKKYKSDIKLLTEYWKFAHKKVTHENPGVQQQIHKINKTTPIE